MMRERIRNILLLVLLFLLLMKTERVAAQTKTHWRLTLEANDKGPYGSYLAHQSLMHYFPASKRKDLRSSYNYTDIGPSMYSMDDDSVSLLVLAGFELGLSEEEWINILAFATSGNEIIIFGSILDNNIQEHFGFTKTSDPHEALTPERYDIYSNRKALRLESDSSAAYGYAGRHIRSYFKWGNNTAGNPDAAPLNRYNDNEITKADYSARPKVLGRTEGHINFMRYDVGRGHITLHAAPLVLSNYFLLQPGNRAYLDSVWHSLPANISKVYWSDYYRRDEEQGGSPLQVLMSHPSTNAAFLLFVGGLLLYVLFSMKRRQRIIPIVKPVENSSVQFVETIGRLYYNQGVHRNLAEKMAQHFLDWVRSVYYIDTAVLNDSFVTALAAKSGFGLEEVRSTVGMLQAIRNGNSIDENYLYRIHQALQKYYERHPYSQI